MGCFLACFGFSPKKKRWRKPYKTLLIGDNSYGSYEPLDSHVRINLDAIEADSRTPPASNQQPETTKMKKKVRFDLNVRAYEPPVSPVDYEEVESESEDAAARETVYITAAVAERDPIGSSGGSHGQILNYRYQNCIDCYNEDDELAYQDSDFGDTIESSDDEDLDSFDHLGLDDETLFDYSLPKLEEQTPLIHLSEDDAPQELKKVFGSKDNARYRNNYMRSVLTPVENRVQWKMIKAKEAQPSRNHRLKENVLEPIAKFSEDLSVDVKVNSSHGSRAS